MTVIFYQMYRFSCKHVLTSSQVYCCEIYPVKTENRQPYVWITTWSRVFLDKLIVLSYSRNPPHSMEAEYSLPCSHQPTTSYPQQTNPVHYIAADLFNTLRTCDADLRFYITTVQEGSRKSAFLTCACFPCTIHLIMQCIEPVSEWSCWRMFIEIWTHSELNFRHRASSI